MLLVLVGGSSGLVGQEPVVELQVDLRVVDRTTARGIPGVEVLLPDLGVQFVTDSLGHSLIRATSAGVYSLLLVHPAYEEARGDLTIDRSGSFEIALSPVPVVQDGTGGVFGRLTALEDGEPLRDADVRLPAYGLRAATDREGSFLFMNVPTGSTTLTIELLGRAPLTQEVFIRDDEVVAVEVGLPIDPIELPGITVSVLPRWLVQEGFLRRQRWLPLYTGRQWTAEDIAMSRAVVLGDLIRETPGVVGSSGVGFSNISGCPLTVFVNGLPAGDNFDLDSILPEELEALEVYRGGRGRPLPMGFGSRNCGLILVWLRR